jgi:protein-L-isoaspartate(D-aspartate) O-methyltransferase
MDTNLARNQMLTQQVRAWDVSSPKVLETLASVPRESFVPERYTQLAFADTGIPLDHGQAMLAPKIEGRLLQALDIRADDTVLEIGTGTGFLTCCISRLARHVTSIDIFPDFVESARIRLASLGADNVELETADVYAYSPDVTFDAIIVTGSAPELNPLFESWLAPGGRLAAVIGNAPVMTAVRVTRLESGEFARENLFETVITPLVNAPSSAPFEF